MIVPRRVAADGPVVRETANADKSLSKTIRWAALLPQCQRVALAGGRDGRIAAAEAAIPATCIALSTSAAQQAAVAVFRPGVAGIDDRSMEDHP